jgi:hypothetical protein
MHFEETHECCDVKVQQLDFNIAVVNTLASALQFQPLAVVSVSLKLSKLARVRTLTCIFLAQITQ